MVSRSSGCGAASIGSFCRIGSSERTPTAVSKTSSPSSAKCTCSCEIQDDAPLEDSCLGRQCRFARWPCNVGLGAHRPGFARISLLHAESPEYALFACGLLRAAMYRLPQHDQRWPGGAE